MKKSQLYDFLIIVVKAVYQLISKWLDHNF